MSAYNDLMAIAAGLASAARQALDVDAARAASLAGSAKTALEAANLAQNVGPGQIDAALGAIQAELEEAGMLSEAMQFEPEEFLKHVLRVVITWRQEVVAAAGFEHAYETLKALCAGLERDFTVADTETSRRIAARIHTAREEAEQLANPKKEET